MKFSINDILFNEPWITYSFTQNLKTLKLHSHINPKAF
jgi:hypothetical protein